MLSAQESLDRLREGNRRFVSNQGQGAASASLRRRAELLRQQHPFAIILGCSDSRAPVEIIFDQALGDLFVVRVAGNIATPSQIGSIEFGAARLGARLVVVLGHSHCGAVLATIEALRQPTAPVSPSLQSIVEQISPAVEDLLESGFKQENGAKQGPDALLAQAVRANISFTVDCLRQGSDLLRDLARDAGLLVVGAEYSLESGVVEFFDSVDGVESWQEMQGE